MKKLKKIEMEPYVSPETNIYVAILKEIEKNRVKINEIIDELNKEKNKKEGAKLNE